jgi:hypothetical protein
MVTLDRIRLTGLLRRSPGDGASLWTRCSATPPATVDTGCVGRARGHRSPVDEVEERFGDRSRRRRAAGDAKVDGEHGLDRTDEVALPSEQVAAEGAVAECRDAARFRHGAVDGDERLVHAGGDGAGDEEHVGVARGSDDAEPVALEVVVGAADEGQLVLAAVAGAGVDVTDREAAPAVGCGKVDASADAAEISEEGEHQRSAQA